MDMRKVARIMTQRESTSSAAAARALFCVALLLAVVVLSSQPTQAQLTGSHIKGDLGLKAGSQAPPGSYISLFFLHYGAGQVNNKDGDAVAFGDLDLNGGAVVFTMVTKKTFLGANYGLTAVLPILNGKIETPRLDEQTSIGLSDLYVQPVSLGWHFNRADVTTSYGLFMPTGRYTAGAKDNTGLGMWSHELNLGTTVYLTEDKAWHAATNAAFEFHSHKEDSTAQVGNLLTLEGGVGRSFLKGAANLGAVYWTQWKLSDDTFGTLLPTLLVRGNNNSVAAGPEVQFPIASKKKETLYGFLTFRYYREVEAHAATQGDGIVFIATFLTKPLHVSGAKP